MLDTCDVEEEHCACKHDHLVALSYPTASFTCVPEVFLRAFLYTAYLRQNYVHVPVRGQVKAASLSSHLGGVPQSVEYPAWTRAACHTRVQARAQLLRTQEPQECHSWRAASVAVSLKWA